MSQFPVNSEGQKEFNERVVYVNRVAKVVKGGRRFSFSVIVVVGDGNGRVGIGLGKAGEVPEAIRKGSEKAKKSIKIISLDEFTIPHEIVGRFGSSKVFIKPASKGTGVIAGNTIRAVFEAVGIHDVLSKSYGSNNPHNIIRATLKGLEMLMTKKDHEMRRGF